MRGNTEWLMRKTALIGEKRSVETGLIMLRDKNIKMCDG